MPWSWCPSVVQIKKEEIGWLFLLPDVGQFNLIGYLAWLFFHAWGFNLKFVRFALLLKRSLLGSKTALTTVGLISKSHFVVAKSAWNRICKKSAGVISLDDIKSFRSLVPGVFWSVLQMGSYVLAIGLPNINWWAFFNAMYLYFSNFCVSQLPFLASSD